MKPKAYKARAQIERERSERQEIVRKSIKSKLATPQTETDFETVFKCDCGEKSRTNFDFVIGSIYEWECPVCRARHLAKPSKDGAWEMLPANYTGRQVRFIDNQEHPATIPVMGSWDDSQHLSRWWSAMPGTEHYGNVEKASKGIQKRESWLLSHKVKPNRDAEYLCLKGKLSKAHERVFSGYGTIDEGTTEKIRAAQTRLRQRVELLIERSIDPKEDKVIAYELKTIVEGENVLCQIWNESGQYVAFKNPRIRERARDEKRKQIAQAKLRQDGVFDKADKKQAQHWLEERAELLARADKRGHTAPLVAHAKELLFSVRLLVEPKQLPPDSLVYDFARFITWNRCSTWPTIHDLVMAFAHPRKVLQSIIRKMPKNRKRLVTATRPIRYSPSVVHYLLNWWLDNEGKTAPPHIRDGFKNVARTLCH